MVNSEVPQEIKEKYRKGRKFVCEYAGKTVAHGIVEDYVFVTHEEYITGVEKLKIEEDGRTEFRFVYWANKGKGWRWGQFCTMLPRDKLQELFNEMIKKGWINKESIP